MQQQQDHQVPERQDQDRGQDHDRIDHTRTEPFTLFDEWFADARASEPEDPNAMCLSTASPGGAPSSRMVLLKAHDARGFVFYTNLESRKGTELAANPTVALLFHWKSLRRQIRIEGEALPVPDPEADTYFASRDRVSRLGAHASDQSRPLEDRARLEARLQALEHRFPDDRIPRPAHWTGLRVVPRRLEFWHDMPHRLHDRLVFERDADRPWKTTRLYP